MFHQDTEVQRIPLMSYYKELANENFFRYYYCLGIVKSSEYAYVAKPGRKFLLYKSTYEHRQENYDEHYNG